MQCTSSIYLNKAAHGLLTITALSDRRLPQHSYRSSCASLCSGGCFFPPSKRLPSLSSIHNLFNPCTAADKKMPTLLSTSYTTCTFSVPWTVSTVAANDSFSNSTSTSPIEFRKMAQL